MRERLAHLLRLRPGETSLVLALGLLLLCNSLAIQVSNVVSVSGFLEAGGVNRILLVWIADMTLILLATSIQSLVVDRFDRITLVRWLTFGFALLYVILRLMFVLGAPEWLNYSLIYLLTDQQWLFFPLVFWVLANDIFDPAQSKRLFPLIAGLGAAGKLAGLIITIWSPGVFVRLRVNPAELLTMNALIYLIAFVLASASLRSVKLRQITLQRESVREALSEGWGFVREVPSFRYLMLAMLALAVCDTIIEFHFLTVSDAVFVGQANYQTFYGAYKLSLTVASILVQFFLTSRLIERLTLKNSFFVLPAVVLLGLIWALGLPGLVSGLGVMFLYKLSEGTLDETSRKSFQAFVPEERRGRVSMFMDSYLLAFGTILGSLLTGAVVWGGPRLGWTQPFYAYLGVGTLAALVALGAAYLMRQAYDHSLFNWRLKRRQRRGSPFIEKLEFDTE